MSYRVEIATTGRAGCQASRCKTDQVKIAKGELRQGVLIDTGDYQSWKYRHWGCITPLVMHNWWEKAEQSIDLIDGFDELPESAQAKVKQALEQGHVNDNEWNGDEGLNRYDPAHPKKPMYARQKKAKTDAEDDGENGSPEKKTKAGKKRVREDENDDATEDKKPAKKSKAKVKKEAGDEDDAPAPAKKLTARVKKEAEDEDDDATEDKRPVKKSKAKVKKEAVDDYDLPTPAKKKRTSRVKSEGPSESADDEEEQPAASKAKASRKMETDANATEPVKKSRSKKAANEDGGPAEGPKAPAKRKGRKAKAED